MSENKSSQENTLKQNEKIENHIKNHEIPKNEVVESEQMHTSNIEEEEEEEDNKKCPLCFTLFVDQSSIIYDKEYDVLISALYPDIEKVKKESPFGEESNKGPRIVVDETSAGEEPIAMEKPIVEESDDDTASTLQSNKDRPTKKSKTS
ncbi:hypothetical protein P8452_38231 [Trifolium repens]|nr:hypothetical protein P8452_38231 [Trifolium repens]